MTDQTVSDLVGARVRGLREQNKWTRDQLAARCARAGAAWLTSAAITNIELGRRDKDGNRRRDVTVDELVALSAAFSVPPKALLPELAADLEDIDIDTYGVDDLLDRLQAYKEWTKQLEEKAAKDIFGFKRPNRLAYLKARWTRLAGSLKSLDDRRAEVEREIAEVREAVEKLESGQGETQPAVVRRVLAGEPYVPPATSFEVPDEP